jgi:hypothetical protein
LVSLLTKNERCFLVIVNRDLMEPMSFSIETDDTVGIVSKDAAVTPVGNGAEVGLAPGDIAIFTWRQ